MTKIYLLKKLVIVSAIIVICAIPWCNGVISDKRLCYDPDCSVPVALARTMIRYNSIEEYILSFPSNIEIKIFSKEAGRRLDLWGAEVLGKRGYVPKSMVRESRKLKSNLTYEVPTEFPENEVNKHRSVEIDTSNQSKVSQDEKVGPNKIIDAPQASKDVENVTIESGKKNVETDESKSSKDAAVAEPEAPSAPEPSDFGVKEPVEEKAEQGLEGIQNATPSYEVIDGTKIPLASEEVPFKPSYPTPAIAATALPDEVPILSVHPSMPSSGRPVIATFSNLDTQIVEDRHQQQTNAFTENLPSKTDSLPQSPSAQDKEIDSPITKPDISVEYNVKDDSKVESSHDQSFSGNIETPVTVGRTENSEKNVPEQIIPGKDKTSESSDSFVEAPTHANSSEEELSSDEMSDSFADRNQEEKLDVAKNTLDNSEDQKISSNEESLSKLNNSPDLVKEHKNDQDILSAELNNIGTHQEQLLLGKNPSELVQNESKLDASIPEQAFQDSREQTEHLSDENIAGNTKETDRPNNVGGTTGIPHGFNNVGGTTEIPHGFNNVEGTSEIPHEFNNVGGTSEIPHGFNNVGGTTEIPHGFNNVEGTTEIPHGFNNVGGTTEIPHGFNNVEGTTEIPHGPNNVGGTSEIPHGFNNVGGTSEIPHGFDNVGGITEIPHGFNNVEGTTEIPHGFNNVGGTTEIPQTEVTANEQTVAQHDNQVIPNDVLTGEHNEDFTVGNVDDVQDDVKVDTVVEDDLQYDSASEQMEYNDYDSSEEMSTESYSSLGEEISTTSRNLLMAEDKPQVDDSQSNIDASNLNESGTSGLQFSQEYENETYTEPDVLPESTVFDTVEQITENVPYTEEPNIGVPPPDVCDMNSDCADLDNSKIPPNEEQETIIGDEESFHSGFEQHNYLETLLYVSVTAFTTLLFSLGYYYIENQRRDKELVRKINVLEKDLLVTTKESMMLSESLKAAKTKLGSIEDESFGSNEMVLSLKSELEAAQVTRGELEDQIITLEKELESATEAGLELERMLREFLSSQSDENPLAQSVEDLQTRLNAQQATNESLTNSLNLKSQENETLMSELAVTKEKCQGLEVEVTRLAGELQVLSNHKNTVENDYSTKIAKLNKQISKLSGERGELINQLRTKEIALNDLADVLQKQNIDGLDFEKLYDVSHIKAEAQLVIEERDELKSKITEVEGAHQLLEEHMKLVKEEMTSVTKQYELAERDKTEAQTRLEVLSNYFKEKESQLQKELGMQEALWVQKQGEVTSTVDRIQTMQNEIQNYRQQIETLKREILDQEREYKSQISALETKSHEQWVIARQSERRLEESKAEASQLRNRLTMVEKSINEVDPDAKLHRLETNGETASSPQLFMGAESSSSPIIFTGSSGVPPLPPSYLYGAPLPPPFIPPPPHSGNGPMYDISRRPPPLGGRLSSPPPMPLHHPPGRYEDTISPPPPLSPPLHPPYNSLRSPPPLPPFGNEHIHSHPPPPFLPPLGTSHSWGDEPLPPLRNPVFHPHQREQRLRNHKGSLHSSGDSLDKSNHTGKT